MVRLNFGWGGARFGGVEGGKISISGSRGIFGVASLGVRKYLVRDGLGFAKAHAFVDGPFVQE